MKKTQFLLTQIMKISLMQGLITLLFASVSFAKEGKAQDFLEKPISIRVDGAEVKNVLAKIESIADVHFVYSSKAIQAQRKVSANFTNQKLSDVLDGLLKPLKISYRVIGGQIMLNTLVETTTAPIPNVVENPISGRITGSKGEGIPGVSVTVKGTKKGTVTDVDGNYKVNANIGDVLVFSFIGYTTKEVKVESSSVNVLLDESTAQLADVVVVGSRFAKPRTDVDRPVAVDVINAKEIQNSGQVDLGQTITYTAPSFNAVKFGINDTAPFVDPASLRGLGPDQVLVLVNNKRRHKVSFLSINDGVGKGQVGTDVNAVPSLSLKRVEVLRDGAAAQYGSDAIAGVINLELNDASSGGAVSVYTGMGYTTPQIDVTGVAAKKTVYDGKTYNLAANFGLPLGKKGFFNTTIFRNHTDAYDRSGTFKASAGYYVKDPVADAALIKANNINLDRAVLGAAESTGYGIFVNAGVPMGEKWKFYAFGGYTHKHAITGVFTRPPSNTARSVLAIFPNGYNPIAPADLQDFSLTAGIKGNLGKSWNLDLSASQGANKVDFNAENTVNPSLGATYNGAAAPTTFYVGQTGITQTLLNADLAKTFRQGSYPNLSVGAGTEFRYETFHQNAGDVASYVKGPVLKRDVGSSGREGFSNLTAGSWNRTNVGVYVEGESDITKSFLVGTALRVENYSDFGSDFSYKFNTRLRVADPFAIRASVSRGFRAPSMVQSHYSNYANVSFDNAGNSILKPVIPSDSKLANSLGIDGLKKETSLDYSAGITSKLGEHFTLTADIYQIDVDNRIMISGDIDISKNPAFIAAGFTQVANVFVNAIDTRTRGFEMVANYHTNVGATSKLNLNAAYSSMTTTLRNTRTTSTGVVIANTVATTYITDGLPKNKFIASANLDFKMIGFMIRATRFGKVSDPLATLAVKPTDPAALTYQVFASKTLADVAVSIKPSKSLTFTLGVNNLFDVYPDLLQAPQTNNEVVFSRRTNQFGTQGRFVNFAINYHF